MTRRTAEAICRVPDVSHEEWLACRRTGIGGSDAATIVGLNPYSSLYALYNDKLGLLPPRKDTEAMRQGRDLEQYVAERWMEQTGKRCQRSNYMWRSLEHPFMLADVDREVIGENAGLECKTTSLYRTADLERGEIPLTYYVQCQHYMAVMGYERMYLAVLVLNRGFYTFEITESQSERAALVDAEQAFWAGHVAPRVPPELDGSEATQQALGAEFVGRPAGCVNLSRRAAQALQQMDELNEQAKIIQEGINAQKAVVMRELGDAPQGLCDGWAVQWKNQSRMVLDAKRLKKEQPALFSQYAKTAKTRVFRYQPRKGDDRQ